ncbi:MAG: hypothetical protein JW884_01705 [Deltaproteobacteria bacterium]|nr:hypothetical protein [Deltaproteobacteria bacterium]
MITKVSLIKELTLRLEHKVGILEKVSALLAERGINIEACAGYGMPGGATAEIRIVVDDTRRAFDALAASSLGSIVEKDVIAVEVENKPGALRILSKAVADKLININYLYVTANAGTAPVRIVFSTDDNERAFVALKKTMGF